MEYSLKPINLKFVNAYLIKGEEGFILIDTGVKEQYETLETELMNEGCLPDRLKLIIVTHGDSDHVGNCAILKDKYGARIAINKIDYDNIRNGIKVARKATYWRAKLFLLIRRLTNMKRVIDKFGADTFLEDGQSLKEYGWDAEVIHVPGHTKGSIAILTKEGDLFAGDTLSNRVKPEAATFIEDAEELKESIEKLKKLDVKMVYPGHGNPFTVEDLKGISI